MSNQEFASTLLENAVMNLSRLPGVGRKTALRLALHLLRQDVSVGTGLGQSIIELCNGIRYCSVCHNISETDICDICSDPMRDSSTICVVETVKDVMSIERTGQYDGLYHVLGGVISPMDGIGPDTLEIASLIERIDINKPLEIILALGSTMEGETTSFYIYRQVGVRDVKITQLARGLSVGNELEYTDELTLGRSLLNRTLFSDSFK
ncbi:MAG: recombination mediator RecR [Muribaculum sp.]|nr:recombination mediator RecR [Muribaculaceae bacterium]MCM1080965.1 recombination mediator RecR [Muribaculum sp.]